MSGALVCFSVFDVKLIAELRGRQPDGCLEHAAEIAVVAEATKLDDLADFRIRFRQIAFCCSKSAVKEITHNGTAGYPLEKVG